MPDTAVTGKPAEVHDSVTSEVLKSGVVVYISQTTSRCLVLNHTSVCININEPSFAVSNLTRYLYPEDVLLQALIVPCLP